MISGTSKYEFQIPSGRKIILVFLTVLFSFLYYSCETEEFLVPENIKNVRMDMSVNTIDENIYITDLVNLRNNGFIMLGLCSEDQMDSKFDGDGSIYMSYLDINGEFKWDTCFTRNERGFPGAVIKKSDFELYVVWNSFDLDKDTEILQFDIRDIPAVTSIFSRELVIVGEIFDITENFNRDGYYILGLQNDIQNNHFLNIAEVNRDFVLRKIITQRFFDPEQLGGFGLNDLEFLRRISTNIHIEKNFGFTDELDRIVFTGPQDSLMTVSNAGEIIPEYADSRYWVSSILNLRDNDQEYAMIISDSESSNGRTYFNNNIIISGPPDNSGASDYIGQAINLDLIDPNMNILMFQAGYNNDIFFIGGTTKAGQIRLFKIEGKKSKKYSIGGQIPLELTGMTEMLNGQILLVGHGVIGNELQKPFVIISDPLLF